MNSRFDFYGISDNKPFILEVKNVPLADYVDCENKEKKNMNFDNYDFKDKISYFPDGYRKKKNQPISERAIKHINELKLETRPEYCQLSSLATGRDYTSSCFLDIHKDNFLTLTNQYFIQNPQKIEKIIQRNTQFLITI